VGVGEKLAGLVVGRDRADKVEEDTAQESRVAGPADRRHLLALPGGLDFVVDDLPKRPLLRPGQGTEQAHEENRPRRPRTLLTEGHAPSFFSPCPAWRSPCLPCNVHDEAGRCHEKRASLSLLLCLVGQTCL